MGNKLQHGHLDADDGGTLTAAALPTKVAVICDRKTQGTNGETFTSGAWRTRDLNTEIYGPDGIVSISSNQFTLTAGTYRIKWSAPARTVDLHQSKLRNATDGIDVGEPGSSETCQNTGDVQSRSVGYDRVTIAASKAFEIQHQCQTTVTTNGFGRAVNFAAEIYTIVEITKE